MEDYIVTGKLVYVFINFPLSFHAQAQLAAETAACAGEQGQFWPMHDQLYLNQAEWADNDGALSVFLGYGRKLNLDQAAFQTCLGNHAMAQKVQDDYAFGVSIGVPSTPSFVINGQPLVGAQPYSAFRQLIDAALAQP
jgi:protein-disulfide isomerase